MRHAIRRAISGMGMSGLSMIALVVVSAQSAIGISICYLTGWGPALGLVTVIIAALNFQTVGAQSWCAATVVGLVGIGCGQAALGLGWVYSYIPLPQAHAVAAAGAAASAIIIWLLGNILGRLERETAERSRAEKALRSSEERFRALVQESSDIVAVTDEFGAVTYVSPAVERVLGYPPERYAGIEQRDLIHPDDQDRLVREWLAVVAGGGELLIELRVLHANGSWRWHEVAMRNLLHNPAVNGLVYNYRDITERKAYQEQLAYDASHDALTGLANRATFLRVLDNSCGRDHGEHTAVLYVDLDGFKQINDDLGHEAGDTVLRTVAAGLRRGVRDGDTVGRIGGDEFGVVMPGLRGSQSAIDIAVAVAERVIAQLDPPITIMDQPVQVGASVGIAVSGHGHASADDLLRQADAAMYLAKRGSASGWRLHAANGTGVPRAPLTDPLC